MNLKSSKALPNTSVKCGPTCDDAGFDIAAETYGHEVYTINARFVSNNLWIQKVAL